MDTKEESARGRINWQTEVDICTLLILNIK